MSDNKAETTSSVVNNQDQGVLRVDHPGVSLKTVAEIVGAKLRPPGHPIAMEGPLAGLRMQMVAGGMAPLPSELPEITKRLLSTHERALKAEEQAQIACRDVASAKKEITRLNETLNEFDTRMNLRQDRINALEKENVAVKAQETNDKLVRALSMQSFAENVRNHLQQRNDKLEAENAELRKRVSDLAPVAVDLVKLVGLAARNPAAALQIAQGKAIFNPMHDSKIEPLAEIIAERDRLLAEKVQGAAPATIVSDLSFLDCDAPGLITALREHAGKPIRFVEDARGTRLQIMSHEVHESAYRQVFEELAKAVRELEALKASAERMRLLGQTKAADEQAIKKLEEENGRLKVQLVEMQDAGGDEPEGESGFTPAPGSRAYVAEVMADVFRECEELRGAGQKEYAHDDQRAFANFEKIADDFGISREMVLLIYAKKHYDGIVSYVKGHKSQRESVKGRINDLIVYMVLLRAMVECRELEEEPHHVECGHASCPDDECKFVDDGALCVSCGAEIPEEERDETQLCEDCQEEEAEESDEDQDDAVKGKTFAITGTLAKHSRDEVKDLIVKAGGKVTDHVHTRVDYLVAGPNPGSKLAKANALGLDVISEEELEDMLGLPS